jgi:hypothetical protein
MSMIEEGDEALGFEGEIYWLNGQAEMWLDRIGRTITETVNVDRSPEPHSRAERHRAGGKACFVAAYRAAKIEAGLAVLRPGHL